MGEDTREGRARTFEDAREHEPWVLEPLLDLTEARPELAGHGQLFAELAAWLREAHAPLLASVDPDARALKKKLENAERVELVSKRDRLLE